MSADPVLERPGQVHSDDLVGCVYSVSINGRLLNLTNPITSRGVKSTCGRFEQSPCARTREDSKAVCGNGRCYDKWHQVACQCGDLTAPNCRGALEPVTLSDRGYIEFKVHTLSYLKICIRKSLFVFRERLFILFLILLDLADT